MKRVDPPKRPKIDPIYGVVKDGGLWTTSIYIGWNGKHFDEDDLWDDEWDEDDVGGVGRLVCFSTDLLLCMSTKSKGYSGR